MSDDPKWWTEIWNPWQGCTPCRPKCGACYNRQPDSRFERFGLNFSTVRRSSKATFTKPLRLPPGTPVAVCLASDFFHEAADEWRATAWEVMYEATHRGVGPFIIPTSRPQRIIEHGLPTHWGRDWGKWGNWHRIWFLASVADQADADELLPELLKVPVGHLGVSHEPALGVVDWRKWMPEENPGLQPYESQEEFLARLGDEDRAKIAWIITGGCNHNRDWQWHMPIEAAQADRDQAAAAGIPFMFKGHGEWVHTSQITGPHMVPMATWRGLQANPRDSYLCVGRRRSGFLLDGQRHDGFPQETQCPGR